MIKTLQASVPHGSRCAQDNEEADDRFDPVELLEMRRQSRMQYRLRELQVRVAQNPLTPFCCSQSQVSQWKCCDSLSSFSS
jgi:hypothetical protein